MILEKPSRQVGEVDGSSAPAKLYHSCEDCKTHSRIALKEPLRLMVFPYCQDEHRHAHCCYCEATGFVSSGPKTDLFSDFTSHQTLVIYTDDLVELEWPARSLPLLPVPTSPPHSFLCFFSVIIWAFKTLSLQQMVAEVFLLHLSCSFSRLLHIVGNCWKLKRGHHSLCSMKTESLHGKLVWCPNVSVR